MNDPRRPDQTRRPGDEPNQGFRHSSSPYTDPAYADQSAYAPPQDQGTAASPTASHPTGRLPQYWLQDQGAPDQPTQQLSTGRPRTPRWLWIAAAAAVLLVVASVIALVIADGSARQTAVPALPEMPSSTGPGPTISASPSPVPSSAPSATASATPSAPGSGAETNDGAVDAVVYSVTGEGRAISITYRDNGGVIHTEFNVALPWSKEVDLPKSGTNANITIVNIGHDVTCTLTVAGEQVRQHTGAGLTICDAPA